MTDQPNVPSAEPTPQKPQLPSVTELKAIIEGVKNGTTTMSAADLLSLADQLANHLSRPQISRSKMTPEERRAHRKERREARKRGDYIRQGKPWTEEQRQKQQAAWTPERRAAAAEKAKGRVMSPEAKENVRAAAALRKQRQEQMQARLQELEALLAEKTQQVQPEANGQPEAATEQSQPQHGRGGRRR